LAERTPERGVPLRFTALVRVDTKGRVTIPQTIREAIGIDAGMTVVIIADVDKREVILTPVSPDTSKLYEIIVDLLDVTGALAKLTGKLAELGVDIVATKCASIVRAELASCTIIGDFTQAKKGVEEVKRELEAVDVVRHVKIKSIGTTSAL